MTPPIEISAAERRELELGGVILERREMLIQFVLICLGQRMSVNEIRPSLVDYIKAKGWPWMQLDARYGIVEVAMAQFHGTQPPDPEPVPDQLQRFVAEDVEPEPVPWLWPGHIPMGQVTVVYGDAGLGKTSWALDLAARVSAGIIWPASFVKPVPRAPAPAKVLVLNGEDHLPSMIRPRLAAGGARLQDVIVLPGLKTGANGEERPFELQRDLPALRQEIEAAGNVRLVIIDPLEAHCDAGPTSQRMRKMLAALEKLARDCGVAVVVISARKKCELPVKTVLRIDCEIVDSDLRWLIPVRCGSGRLPSALGFTISEAGITWNERHHGYREDQMVGCPVAVQRQYRKMEVASWLQFFLGRDQPHYVQEVLSEGARAGHSPSQVRSARLALHVASYKESGRNGQWIWELTDRKIPIVNPPLGTAPTTAATVVPPAVTPVAEASPAEAESRDAAEVPDTDAAPDTDPAPVADEPERQDVVTEQRQASAAIGSRIMVAADRDDSEPPGVTIEQLQDRLDQWDKEFERVTGLKANFD